MINIPAGNISFTSDVTSFDCSYNFSLTDTTDLESPVIPDLTVTNRGTVDFYAVEGDTETLLGSVQKGGTLIVNGCAAGTFTIKQVFTIREIANCGGTSAIIAQGEETSENVFTIVEWKPTVQLNSIPCCFAKDESVELFCTFDFNYTEGCTTGTIVWTSEKEINGVWTVEDIITHTNPVSEVTASFVFTPATIGVYRISCTIENCCANLTTFEIVSVCNGVRLDKTGCNVWTLRNYTTSIQAYTIEKFDGEDFIAEATGSISPISEEEITFTEEGVYKVTVEGEALFVYAFCTIDTCIANLQTKYLCDGAKLCDDCLTVEDRQIEAKLLRILGLYEVYKKLVDRDMEFQIKYANVESIKIEELYNITELYKVLKDYCVDCTEEDSDCGCVK